MIHLKVPLMAAPIGMQPSPYIVKAYAGVDEVATDSAELFVERTRGWQVRLRWKAPQPIENVAGDPNRFVDACAILTGETLEAPWITMGAPGQAVSGALWRADRETPYRVRAEGFGSVERSEPGPAWNVVPVHANGMWDVTFELGAWEAIDHSNKIGVAIWQGARRQRAGLKSVSTDWVSLAG